MDRLLFYRKLSESEYGKKYLDLIELARTQEYCKSTQKKELHHIYPRSFEEGKIDDESNLVYLTVFDHILAHYYLAKSIRVQQTCYAFRMICDLHLDEIDIAEQKTVLQLEEYAKLRKESRVVSAEMRQHRRESALGKINIFKGNLEKKIYPADLDKFIQDGWTRGRAGKVYNPSKGKVWIYKDGVEKNIFEPELNQYAENGWTKGRAKSSTKGKIRMIKDGQIKYATQETLQQMLDEGWVKGACQHRIRKIIDGKIRYVLPENYGKQLLGNIEQLR